MQHLCRIASGDAGNFNGKGDRQADGREFRVSTEEAAGRSVHDELALVQYQNALRTGCLLRGLGDMQYTETLIEAQA